MRSVGAVVNLEGELRRLRSDYKLRNPQSLKLHTCACRYLPGGNTRTGIFSSPFPLFLASGAGARVLDVDGNGYVDFFGDFTAGIYGHANPRIVTAVQRALEGDLSLGAHHLRESELARAITSRFPSMARLRFCNSGTEANLLALATAVSVTKRSKVIAFSGAYHGSLLTITPRGEALRAPFQILACPYNDLDRVASAARENASELAAIIVEPMMGAAGCIPGTGEFLTGLREMAQKYSALLIFDEVQTSRLGWSGLQGIHGIKPDLTTLGKYFGGGLSFGAFGGSADIMDRYDPSRPGAIGHSGTFNNNTCTMAAGIAGAELLTRSALKGLNDRGEVLRGLINSAAARRSLSMRATGIGSILHVHFTSTSVSNAEQAEHTDPQLTELLHLWLQSKGYLIAPRGMISLSLPLEMPEVVSFAAALEEFMEQHSSFIGERGQ